MLTSNVLSASYDYGSDDLYKIALQKSCDENLNFFFFVISI